MEVSGFLLNMTKLTLDALFKMTNADIRTHGESNIPDQPIVYVMNHFTRMETFFLPYIIHRITKKNTLSLAFHGFFGGSFGNYLSKLGAVSTQAPDRDKILMGSLLRNEYPCMIYPEGQMVKDKKLIEKGKYMVYNTGIRRPPHTGAALLALQAQFFLEKLRHFHESGYDRAVQEYRKYFNIGKGISTEKILKQEIQIVPVNLTYFPIRARDNIIKKMAERFMDKLPDRLDEELSVEGAMLVDGVDIDIYFGEPIPMGTYMENRRIRKKIESDQLFLSKDEIRHELGFRKQAVDLMYRYMDSIYKYTTVNHDHIFSYILSKSKKRVIRETDFKNRAYYAIKKIKNLKIPSEHTFLQKTQERLINDDMHPDYVSFIDAAISHGLITKKDGCIIKHKSSFSKPYEFHTIRKDNIIEVLKNEIEPMKNVIKNINHVMRIPSFFIRRKIRNIFLKEDMDIFNADYDKYFIQGESKPREIGQPFFLKRRFSKHGALLIHGYMAAPEEIRQLADYLYSKGYTVYGVRLRGHGTAPEDLAIRTWEDWYESANRGYVVLKNTVPDLAIAGFSTGAGIALLQAMNSDKHIKCIVSINTPLRLTNIASRFASAVVVWNNMLKKIKVPKGSMEYVSNDPENPQINYFRNPISGVSELEKFMTKVENRLGEVDLPVLVVQGSNDPVVNPESGLETFEKIGTTDKQLFRVHATRHGILRGEGSERVFSKIEVFLKDIFSRKENECS